MRLSRFQNEKKMLKSIYRYAAALVVVMTSFVGLTSCSDDGNDEALPQIAIRNVQADETSVLFTLVPTNATSYAYCVATEAEYKDKNYKFTTVESAEQKSLVVDGLETGKTYYIVAVAYNGNLTSKEDAIRIFTGDSVAITMELKDPQVGADYFRCVLLCSKNTTFMMYTYYPKGEEAPEDTSKWIQYAVKSSVDLNPGQPALPELDFEKGNAIEIPELSIGEYVLEAVPFSGNFEGERLIYEFKVDVIGRPYVSARLNDLTFEGVNAELSMNKECGSYYAGFAPAENFDGAAVLNILNSDKKPALQTENFSGALLSIAGGTSEYWVPNTKVMFWILPCEDKEGTIPETMKNVISQEITIPRFEYALNGKAVIAVEFASTSISSFEATVKATDCAKYYMIHNSKEFFESKFYGAQNLILDSLMKTTPIELMENKIERKSCLPDTEYVVYAVGEDNEGKLGKLTTATVRTKAVDFSGSAAVKISADPEITTAFVTFTPEGGCTKVRYAFMTNETFTKTYGANINTVKNQLALNTLVGAVELDMSKGAETVNFSALTANTFYLVFALAMDADGKFGDLKEEVVCKTKKLDFKNKEAIIDYGKPLVQNGHVRFTATPMEGCKEYYVGAISNNELGSSPTASEIVAKLLADTKTLHYYGEDGEDAPKKNIEITVWARPSTVYILCVDAEGRYNDPRKTPAPIEVQ